MLAGPPECDDLSHADWPIQIRLDALGEVADQAFRSGLLGCLIEYLDRSVARLEHTEDEFDERGFSAAVWAEDAELSVLLDIEIDAFERLDMKRINPGRGIGEGHMIDVDSVHAGLLRCGESETSTDHWKSHESDCG